MGYIDTLPEAERVANVEVRDLDIENVRASESRGTEADALPSDESSSMSQTYKKRSPWAIVANRSGGACESAHLVRVIEDAWPVNEAT